MARTWKPDPTGRRRERMPVGWAKIRAKILQRDHNRCTWINGEPDGGTWRMWADIRRCPEQATDVDHIGAHDNHDPANLRALCHGHHAHRTGVQANAAKREHGHTRMRPKQQHPGLSTYTDRTRD